MVLLKTKKYCLLYLAINLYAVCIEEVEIKAHKLAGTERNTHTQRSRMMYSGNYNCKGKNGFASACTDACMTEWSTYEGREKRREI